MPTGDYTDFNDITAYQRVKKKFARESAPHPPGPRQQFGQNEAPSFTPYTGYITDTTPMEVKEREVRRKMKFLTAMNDVVNGKLPTNEQLKNIIASLQSSRSVQQARGALSPDGMRVFTDFDNLMETMKVIIDEKNQNEDIQQFLFHSRLASQMTAQQLSREEAMELGQATAVKSKEAFSNLFTIARLMVTSSDFRELVYDLNELVQDSLTGFAHTETTMLRRKRKGKEPEMPVEERAKSYAQYGEPVGWSRLSAIHPEHKSFAEYGQPLSRKPTTSSTTGMERKTSMERPMTSTMDRPSTSTMERPTTSTMERPSMERKPTASSMERKATTGSLAMEETMMEEPEQQRSGILQSEHVSKLQKAFTQELTPEKQTMIAQRFKNIMLSLQDDPEYRDAIHTLFSYAKSFAETSYYMGDRFSGQRVSPRVDANIRMAREEFKTVLERFAGNYSLDPLLRAIFKFYQHTQEDFHLRDYLNDLRNFLVRSLDDKAFLQDRDYDMKASAMLDRGRRILGTHYRDDTGLLLDETNKFLSALNNDPLTSQLADNIVQINRDLFMNERGQYTFKTSILGDIVNVVLPTLAKQIKYIPIPRIEHNDPNFHILIENVILTTDNLVPNVFEMAVKNRAVVGMRSGLGSYLNNSLTLNFYQIHANIQDVPFYYKKKTFPRMKDYGVMDVFVGGEGICVLTKLGIDRSSPTRTLIPRKVEVFVDNLDIRIHETTRDALYNMVGPALNTAVKTQIQRSMEEQIRAAIMRADDMITRLKLNYLDTRKMKGLGANLDRFMKSVGLKREKKQIERKPVYKRPVMMEKREAPALPGQTAWTSDSFNVKLKSAQAF